MPCHAMALYQRCSCGVLLEADTVVKGFEWDRFHLLGRECHIRARRLRHQKPSRGASKPKPIVFLRTTTPANLYDRPSTISFFPESICELIRRPTAAS